jgi:carboxyl-terminal processing protease
MGIDPHTLVFSPEAFKDFSVHIEGEICGVGMYVGTREGKLTVIEVLKDTPAAKAGFKKGDTIAKIDDESTINMTVSEAVNKIRGECGSGLTLTVKRLSKNETDDSETLQRHEISVVRGRVVIKSVESKLITNWDPEGVSLWKGGVGYIQVINFDKNTTRGLKHHLGLLKADNGGPLAGLILDLRGNSGGLLTQAIKMCDVFLDSGDIVITADRTGPQRPQEARDQGDEPEYPIIVLANESSASGAEIVTGALQKNNRAIVIGTRTFGKGSVQQLHPLPNRAQLKITVSEYLIPGKISIQENGVVPDIMALPVVDDRGVVDLFVNERSIAEKRYETRLVSRYAKKESPLYTLHYLYIPPEDDPYTDRFMSGNLEPSKEKLVQVALDTMKLAGKPFSPSTLLKTKKATILKHKQKLVEEIADALKKGGIDWNQDPSGTISSAEKSDLTLSLSSGRIEEPSKDKEDPVPVNKILITATLTNKGETPLYRMKGLSRSDYFLYKDKEFLFGKIAPGEAVTRTIKVRIPYFPHARNDVFSVDVSTTSHLPDGDAMPSDPVILSSDLSIEMEDNGRPGFAYSAQLLEVAEGESEKRISSLSVGSEARLRVKIRNIGDAPAHKGITILRNETGRQIFLKKGRIEFTDLLVQGETEVEFDFEVRPGDLLDKYDFELMIADSYSGMSLTQDLNIPSREHSTGTPFPNGVEFAAPVITASIRDPETQETVLLTDKKALLLEALVKSPDTNIFKAWVFNIAIGEHETPPDKIYFAKSRGEEDLKITTVVPLKEGINLFTVVSNGKNGLESRQSLVVRRR